MEICTMKPSASPLNDVLKHMAKAIQTALCWNSEDADLARKIASVRSLARSFQYCFEQAGESIEINDYLEEMVQMSPSYSRLASALKCQRDGLRIDLSRVVRQLECLTSDNSEAFLHLCNQLHSYLKRFDSYCHNETRLLQEVFNQETGGEG